MLYKKDYKAIAEILKENLHTEYYGYTGYASGLADSICKEFADYLAIKNPNFDREKFLMACGL